jgi:hypothetical protein
VVPGVVGVVVPAGVVPVVPVDGEVAAAPLGQEAAFGWAMLCEPCVAPWPAPDCEMHCPGCVTVCVPSPGWTTLCVGCVTV